MSLFCLFVKYKQDSKLLLSIRLKPPFLWTVRMIKVIILMMMIVIMLVMMLVAVITSLTAIHFQDLSQKKLRICLRSFVPFGLKL